MNKKEQMVGYLLFEIKGTIDSVIEMIEDDEPFCSPPFYRLQKKVDEAIKLFTSVGESDSNEINFEK